VKYNCKITPKEVQMAAEYYDREKLYEEIWKEPMTVVSKRYGVSDVALSKTCKKLKVPKPPLGYWAKRKAGQNPKTPKLPKFKDAPRQIIRKSVPFIFNQPKKVENKDYLVPEIFIQAQELIAKESLPEMKIIIPEDIKSLHPFVRNTRRVFKEKHKSNNFQEYNRYSTKGEGVFNLDVSEDSLHRATLILQALCVAFKKRGFKLLEVEKKEFVQVEIMGKYVSLKISEKSIKREMPDKNNYPSFEFIPSGRLKMEIVAPTPFEGQKNWTDGKNEKLEDKLIKFISGMINAAAWAHEYETRWESWKVESVREEKIRKEKDRFEKNRLNV
jgi:hypothetical protein